MRLRAPTVLLVAGGLCAWVDPIAAQTGAFESVAEVVRPAIKQAPR